MLDCDAFKISCVILSSILGFTTSLIIIEMVFTDVLKFQPMFDILEFVLICNIDIIQQLPNEMIAYLLLFYNIT